MIGFASYRKAVTQGRYVRVVNYHNTPGSDVDGLRAELTRLRDTFACITLEDLDRFHETGRWATDRPGFVPVFYEGYRNSALVAGPVCDELGLSAFFFVCTGFLDTPWEEQEQFARSHQIDLVPEELDGRRLAMTWDEVRELSRRHTVTPHTASHDGIADLWTDEDLEREIVEPKRRLDGVTGQDSPAMAFLWGTPLGGSERHADAVRRAGYRYLVSNTAIQRVR